MTDLIAVQRITGWEKLKTLVLDSVSSPITKRVYNMALDEFLGWFQQAPRPGFTKATVSAWRVSLEVRGLGSSSIIIRMSAIRKLAAEAADNGLLAPELAAGISRVKSAKTQGIRTGNWLSQRQAQALLSAPDITTLRGLRDRAILAVLLGCGLRRAELVGLKAQDFQIREEHWVIADLIGKGKHIRTVPVPVWIKRALDCWTAAAEITGGTIFRRVNRMGKLWSSGITPKAIWHVVKAAATRAGISKLAPHDLRRSCARFCHLSGGELEQIQFLLGHASVQTTERYLGCKQKLRHAVNDNLGLEDS